MSPVKRFLLWTAAAYAAIAIFTFAAFGPPRLSAAYLEAHGDDHDRYLETILSDEYVLHMQSPRRHPADEALAADIAFVSEYRNRPEFRRADFRRSMSQFLFDALNAGVVVVLAVRFGRQPLLSFLDRQIAELRNRLQWAEEAAKEAEAQKRAAQERLSHLDEERMRIARQTHELIVNTREAIQAATEQNVAQIESEAEERIHVEQLEAAKRMKQELVDRAIERLKERYERERSEATVGERVEAFVSDLERRP